MVRMELLIPICFIAIAGCLNDFSNLGFGYMGLEGWPAALFTRRPRRSRAQAEHGVLGARGVSPAV